MRFLEGMWVIKKREIGIQVVLFFIIRMTKENSDEEMADAASSCTDAQHSQNTQFHTFNNTRVTPNKNDLR